MTELDGVRDFFNAADAFARHNGMRLIEVREGYARAEMTIAPWHLNGAGVVHGGALFTLADFAFAAASNSQGRLALSIQSSIAIFRPSREGKLFAEAQAISTGNQLAGFRVEVRREDGELVASFEGLVYRTGKPLAELIGERSV